MWDQEESNPSKVSKQIIADVMIFYLLIMSKSTYSR